MSVSPKSRGRYPGTAHAVSSNSSSLSSQQPPSYTSVDHANLEEGPCPVIMDFRQNSASTSNYWRRIPPPTYSESQLNLQIQHSISPDCLPVIWTRNPRVATCSSCGSRGVTITQEKISKNTHIAALTLCMLGCWPCCLIPYLPMCQMVRHYCKRCNYLLGVYDPWDFHEI